MIRILISLCLLFSFAWLTESCSIQKRKHRPGWHITTNWKKSSKDSRSNNEEIRVSKTKILSKSDSTEVAVIPTERSTKHSQNSTFKSQKSETFRWNTPSNESVNSDADESRLNGAKQYDFSSDTSSDRIKKQSIKEENEEPEEEEPSHFWATFTGGFLGVLLALIVVTPLFLVLLLLNDGELDDEIFSTGSDDSFFVTAFKDSFNAVIKYGIAVLWIALMLTFLVLLFYLGYSIGGILGGLLAVLLFVVLILLLAYMLGNVIDFILPDY